MDYDLRINSEAQKRQRAIIVDNFYHNPDSVRELALNVEYNEGGIGRGYIGSRSTEQYFFEGIKETFEELIGLKITTWENHQMNGRFQYNVAGEPLVYHCDENRWAAMIFLSPDSPPEAGTTIYRHKVAKVYHNSSPEIMNCFNQKTFLDRTPYEPVDVFGNVYNRLVIFDGGLIHGASTYFGSDMNDGRLWHMFFFDTEL